MPEHGDFGIVVNLETTQPPTPPRESNRPRARPHVVIEWPPHASASHGQRTVAGPVGRRPHGKRDVLKGSSYGPAAPAL